MNTPAWAAIADTARMYDVFTRADVVRWLGKEYLRVTLDVALQKLLADGTIVRVGRGMYRWTHSTN